MKKYFIFILIINLLNPKFSLAQNLELSTDYLNDYQTEIQKEEVGKQIIVFLFIIVLFSWMTAFLGRTKSWWIGGVIGFSLGVFIWWISDIWFFMPLFLISSLVYDYFVSRHYKEYRSCEKGKFWCAKKNLKK